MRGEGATRGEGRSYLLACPSPRIPASTPQPSSLSPPLFPHQALPNPDRYSGFPEPEFVLSSQSRFRPAVDDAVVTELRAVVGEAALGEVIDVLLETTPAVCDRVERAAAMGDLAALRAAAHELKGTTTNLGATRLPEICDQVEAYARAGDLALAKSLAAWIRSEYQQVHDHLDLVRGGMRDAGWGEE